MHNYINNQTVEGVIWSAVERFSVQAIQFVLTIILAEINFSCRIWINSNVWAYLCKLLSLLLIVAFQMH